MRLAKEQNMDKMMDLLSRMDKKTNGGFPPDHGYLHNDRLLVDLKTVDKTFEEMQLEGAKKIKFYYM